jgi:hypothetical protein
MKIEVLTFGFLAMVKEHDLYMKAFSSVVAEAHPAMIPLEGRTSAQTLLSMVSFLAHSYALMVILNRTIGKSRLLASRARRMCLTCS